MLDPRDEAINAVFAKHNVRIVGSGLEKDPFDDRIVILHPHIVDLFNMPNRDMDPLCNDLEALGYRVGYRTGDNAILLKEK